MKRTNIKDKPVRVVLWSGGMDSTYLIDKSLKEGYRVVAHYVELVNNSDKTLMEKRAIDNMLPYFKKYNFEYRGVAYKANVLEFDHDLCFAQAPVWLNALLYCTSSQRYGENYEMSVGYVMNDDAISYLEDFKRIWKSFSPILDKYGKKLPKLTFPLSKIDKSIISCEMCCIEELYTNIWTCENPKPTLSKEGSTESHFIKCGECHSCKRNPKTKRASESYGLIESPCEIKPEKEVICVDGADITQKEIVQTGIIASLEGIITPKETPKL